jgi:cytochrome c-type biogenesis protein CcmH/NrfG
MSEENKPPSPSTISSRVEQNWSGTQAYLLAAFCLLLGVALGYLFRGSASSMPQAVTVTQSTGVPVENTQAQAELQQSVGPLLEAVNRNPGDFDSLVRLGDLYYDGQQFPNAIQYYERALVIHPENPDVRTDLGTAYWYTGNADKALA